ncbi:Uncharacterised protein [Mycobacteroides abscessus subsp. abscessus]|nr:Uncharacterised protein [Mycobacteroides abscessus subsp. abscessus]
MMSSEEESLQKNHADRQDCQHPDNWYKNAPVFLANCSKNKINDSHDSGKSACFNGLFCFICLQYDKKRYSSENKNADHIH